jgi:hypothetical protein
MRGGAGPRRAGLTVPDISVRTTCAALGVVPPLSVCRDVLGFTRGRVPTRLSTARDVPAVSLRSYVGRLRDANFDVTLILAGSDAMTVADEQVIDYAVWRLREIYSEAGICVRLVHRDPRLVADSLGHDMVFTSDEIIDTGHDLTVDGDRLPVVLPADMNVTRTKNGKIETTLGQSPIKGPCGHRDEDGQNSAVVMVNGEETARTLAHEIGHYLGCEHPATAGSDLMTQTGKAVSDAFEAVSIVASDRAKMRDHCAMQPGMVGV